MLPVAELLSVGREPLERSIWASLRGGKNTHQRLTVSFLIEIKAFKHHSSTTGQDCCDVPTPFDLSSDPIRQRWVCEAWYCPGNEADSTDQSADEGTGVVQQIKNMLHPVSDRTCGREILRFLNPPVKDHHVHFSMQISKLQSNLHLQLLYFQFKLCLTGRPSVSLLIKQRRRRQRAKVNGM